LRRTASFDMLSIKSVQRTHL